MDNFDSGSQGQPPRNEEYPTPYFSKPKLLQHPKTQNVSVNDLPKTSNARDDSRSDPDITFSANFGKLYEDDDGGSDK